MVFKVKSRFENLNNKEINELILGVMINNRLPNVTNVMYFHHQPYIYIHIHHVTHTPNKHTTSIFLLLS